MRKGHHRTIVQILNLRPQVCRSIDIFLLRLAESLRGRGWQTVHIFSSDPPESFRKRLQRARISLPPNPIPYQLGSGSRTREVNPPLQPGDHSDDVHVGFQSFTLVAEMGEPRTVLGCGGSIERSMFPEERAQETSSEGQGCHRRPGN